MSTVALVAVWAGRLPGPTYEPTAEGSPGFAGFVATFLLAGAIIALGVSFTRRMRRATHRERLRQQQEEAAARAGSAADPAVAAPGHAPAEQAADGAAPATAVPDAPDEPDERA